MKEKEGWISEIWKEFDAKEKWLLGFAILCAYISKAFIFAAGVLFVLIVLFVLGVIKVTLAWWVYLAMGVGVILLIVLSVISGAIYAVITGHLLYK